MKNSGSAIYSTGIIESGRSRKSLQKSLGCGGGGEGGREFSPLSWDQMLESRC